MTRLMMAFSMTLVLLCSAAPAQSVVLFNFENVPVYTPFPINVTAGGVTASLSGGYSIQSSSTAPVVPVGFTGHYIYPNSVYLSNLLIAFSQPITSFSILYSPQELGCDDSATMRVTAYMNTTLVGTHTTTAANPGTWPVDTLACTFPQGFNHVVVHYDSHPPTCTDWGPIFLADDMTITVAPTGSIISVGTGCGGSGVPTFTSSAPHLTQNVTFSLSQATHNANGFVYFSGVPAAPLALGSGCVVRIDLATATALFPVTTNSLGAWSTTLAMPGDPSLVGLQIALQAALFPTSGPLGFDLSNGLIATMGF